MWTSSGPHNHLPGRNEVELGDHALSRQDCPSGIQVLCTMVASFREGGRDLVAGVVGLSEKGANHMKARIVGCYQLTKRL